MKEWLPDEWAVSFGARMEEGRGGEGLGKDVNADWPEGGTQGHPESNLARRVWRPGKNANPSLFTRRASLPRHILPCLASTYE